MLGENKSLRKQVATRVVPPSKLLAQQNPLEFIPVVPPQPEATRQRKLDSGTQTSFPKSPLWKKLAGGRGEGLQGEERVRATVFSRLTWASQARHQWPGKCRFIVFLHPPKWTPPLVSSMQIFPVGLSGAPWPGPASNVAGPHQWDATPFPPQASADLRLLRRQFPCKALRDQDLEVVPPVPYKKETGRRRGAIGALACGGYRAADRRGQASSRGAPTWRQVTAPAGKLRLNSRGDQGGGLLETGPRASSTRNLYQKALDWPSSPDAAADMVSEWPGIWMSQ